LSGKTEDVFIFEVSGLAVAARGANDLESIAASLKIYYHNPVGPWTWRKYEVIGVLYITPTSLPYAPYFQSVYIPSGIPLLQLAHTHPNVHPLQLAHTQVTVDQRRAASLIDHIA
jgi:hypothetical protein